MASSSSTSILQAFLCFAAIAIALGLATEMELTATAAPVTCGTVTSSLSKCLPFLTGKVASAPAACCTGVKNLYTSTKNSKPDRVTVCNCILKTVSSLPNLNAARVAGLPRSCGVNLSYSISSNTKCSAIP